MARARGPGARCSAGAGLRRAPRGSAVTPRLVILGNLLVDDVVFADGRTRMGEAGGAVLYAALGASLWEARVGCVSVCGADYPDAALRALAVRGVALEGVRRLGGPGVRTWLLYENAGRRMVHRLGCPTHAEVSPGLSDIPPGWLAPDLAEARAFHLAPMPLERQAALVAGLPAGTLRALDPHEPVTEESLPRWRALLAQVDVFFPSEHELLLPDAVTEPRQALRRLCGGRLRQVLLKRGAAGGLLYDVQADRLTPWAAAGEAVDPTGAGDAFAAGYLSGRLAGASTEEALQRGVVTAGFAIRAWGPAGLLEAPVQQAR